MTSASAAATQPYCGQLSAVKPAQRPHLPVFFGGSSDAAVRVAGKHANVYALFGETLEGVKETLGKVRASAAANSL